MFGASTCGRFSVTAATAPLRSTFKFDLFVKRRPPMVLRMAYQSQQMVAPPSHYFIAKGLIGEPTAPDMSSGGAMSMNS